MSLAGGNPGKRSGAHPGETILYPPDDVFDSVDDAYMANAGEEHDAQDLGASSPGPTPMEEMVQDNMQAADKPNVQADLQLLLQQQREQAQRERELRAVIRRMEQSLSAPPGRGNAQPNLRDIAPPMNASVESMPTAAQRAVKTGGPRSITLDVKETSVAKPWSTEGENLISTVKSGNFRVSLVNRQVFGQKRTVVRFIKCYVKDLEKKSFSMDVPVQDFEDLQRAFLIVRREAEYRAALQQQQQQQQHDGDMAG